MRCKCGKEHNGTYGESCEDCWADRMYHVFPYPPSKIIRTGCDKRRAGRDAHDSSASHGGSPLFTRHH